ncbi:MAG: tRNA (uridine(34)/cytosine(34)/5-carboxymethylaminomethyluridine(34)-2'-O)-methyltransferase TrmL [Gammaproteobacteria bacterium]
MFEVVLFEPEIPPNTGNIMRLAANSGCRLHLIEPLGFELDDKQLRRAGLDYREYASVSTHQSLDECLASLPGQRYFAVSTKGTATYSDIAFQPGDVMIFGPETRGLPADVLRRFPADRVLRIPMRPDSRSLNLANAVSILVYEAWRQQGFSQREPG